MVSVGPTNSFQPSMSSRCGISAAARQALSIAERARWKGFSDGQCCWGYSALSGGGGEFGLHAPDELVRSGLMPELG